MARRTRGTPTDAYGPAVVDGKSANDTLADAERALRKGDARRAEETYLQALGKLGPFADPRWRSGDALDARTRAQCHARLAAIAFDEDDYDRSLRETALAASARHEAIALDRCTGDDIRFMITALVHSATVHERLGAHAEALEASKVALDFSRFARTQDHDPRTRRSIAAAQRAAARLHRELANRADQAPAVAQPVVTETQPAAAETPTAQPAVNETPTAQPAVAETPAVQPEMPTAEPAVTASAENAHIDLTEPVIDLTDEPKAPPTAARPSTVGPLAGLGLPDEPTRSDLVAGNRVRPDETFADLIDLTDPSPEIPAAPVAPPDLLDEVAAAARAQSMRADGVAARIEEVIEPVAADDDRFARPQRRAERRVARAAATPPPRADDEPSPAPNSPEAPVTPDAEAEVATAAIHPTRSTPLVERRQTERGQGGSAAQLVARSRGQALLARVLMGQSDGEATINAHRAVRTATRARQWAREDPDALPVVALNLIEALVIRADALMTTGHDEVARTDLRRARAIADQLWQACPTSTHAAAVVLVSVRSAAIDRAGHHDQLGADHLAQARLVLSQARALELALPVERAADDRTLDEILDDEQAGDLSGLGRLGDRLLDYLQAMDQDLDDVDTEAPAVPVS
jgi:tetratricopeptide (TPR) repeat protein